MSALIQSPRGTADVLPNESYRWQYVKEKLTDVCERFGYKEIRTPTFEYTELFARGVGETTDIVGKEMYTMTDKGGRSITLRPEGTAGVVRAFLQHGTLKEALPVRAHYITSCFRYEKPQAGRWREHYQLGIELFGAESSDADAEVIKVAKTALNALGIRDTRLEINNIGCRECRTGYHAALREYFERHIGDMCDTCKDRLERNPLRILDCKNPACQNIASEAPVILDYLCGGCREHFGTLKQLLDEGQITYHVNPRIVRGQDYYSGTVFEFVHTGAGAQGTVCGGGRYDRLAEYLGGDPCPGIGFGMGLERLLLILDAEGVDIPRPAGPDIFLAFVGDRAKSVVRDLCYSLQKRGYYALWDINARSLKAQMKYADRIGARRSVVVGDGEMERKMVALRDMETKKEREIELSTEGLLAGIEQKNR